MEKIRFKNLLFDIACSAVACDGNVDEKEIRELKFIDTSTTYFEDIDMSRKLERFVENFKDNEKETINKIIDRLIEAVLNPVEEMLVLEIVLRLVYSDHKIDEKEIDFIKSVRSCLSLDDEVVKQRFGAIDFLNKTKQNIVSSIKPSKDKIESINMSKLENLYASVGEKKKKK